jgi:putative PIN family toxin of toxin-antitoxin system
VFLDTNVIVSAIATRGLCADLFRSVIAEHELVVGEVVIDEVRRVLRQRFHLPADRGGVEELEDFLRSYEVVPKPPDPRPLELHDEADRWILATASAAKVDVLITGDAGIIDIRDKFDIAIATPREFWSTLRHS